MQAHIAKAIADIPTTCWNACVNDDTPYFRHEFLEALEQTGCVAKDTGWDPRHVVLSKSSDPDKVLGVVPAYLKYHSYGEYVFDWAWANAYHRYGHTYYPKLLIAAPFTPVTGSRMLIHPDANETEVRQELASAVKKCAEENHASSIHWLFTTPQDNAVLLQNDFMQRVGNQFHWHNENYADFNDYLQNFSSAKRKKIRRERRRVSEQNIEFEWISRDRLDDKHWRTFYRFYRSTVEMRGAIPYLSLEFFTELGRRMPQHCLLIFARQDGQTVAGAYFLIGTDVLLGRYWGAVRWIPDLHFETCYYQAIEYCIQHGLQRFEAGAQGEHKLNRGLLPTPTYSAHWLKHPEFSHAVADFLQRERAGIDEYHTVLKHHSPFKKSA